MIFIEPPEHYLQKKLQMLWLAAYLTGVPPVGLHALRWTHGQAPTFMSPMECVAYNKSTRYRRQNSPVSEREFLKIGKGHVEAK